MKVLIVAGYQTINYGSALQTLATIKMLEQLNIHSKGFEDSPGEYVRGYFYCNCAICDQRGRYCLWRGV